MGATLAILVKMLVSMDVLKGIAFLGTSSPLQSLCTFEWPLKPGSHISKSFLLYFTVSTMFQPVNVQYLPEVLGTLPKNYEKL